MADNSIQFYTVYQFMARELRLRGAEKEVFAIIYGYARSHAGVAEVSMTRIQGLSGLCRETVTKALAGLKERNFVKCLDAKGVRNANRYEITAPCPSPTSLEIGLVRKSDQSNDLTSHQSINPTSTSRENRLPYYKNNKRSMNTQLDISGDGGKNFKGETTL